MSFIGGNPAPVKRVENLIHNGRPKGAKSKHLREVRHALLLAAAKSKHSKFQNLESYCLYLADEKPESFVHLLGQLIPMQKSDDNDFHYTDINIQMPIEEMMRIFAERIRSVTIDHMNPERDDG